MRRLAAELLAVLRGLRAYRGAMGRLALSLVALALGVGLGFAIHLVNRAALTEFTTGLRSLAGGADVTLRGPARGFDASVYVAAARHPDVAAASPMVELDARVVGDTAAIRVLGIDVFRVPAIQPGLVGVRPESSTGNADADEQLATLRPDRIFLAQPLLDRLGRSVGDTLVLQSGLAPVRLVIAGTLGADIRRAPVATMDIAGAQALGGLGDAITRVDVRVRPGADPRRVARELAGGLPPGVVVEPASEVGSAEAQLSRSYRVNLTVLALVALFTGALLVFSTQALGVVRRRAEFALLRTLGLTPRELVGRLLGEAAVAGAAGAACGLVLGWVLAWLVTRYLGADLGAGFFRGVQPTLDVSPLAALAFFGLGVAAAVLGALGPALEAAQAAPARALKAGDDEQIFARLAPATPGLVLVVGGAFATLLPPVAELPIFGYVAIAAMLVGIIALMPRIALAIVSRLPLSHRPALALAVSQLRGAPGQPAVSLAAIVGAVSLAVSMAIMVASFRTSLTDWLDKLLPADLYLRSGTSVTSGTGFIDPAAQARIGAIPGVRRVEFLRADTVVLDPRRPRVTLLAREIDRRDPGARLPLVREAASLPAGVIPVWLTESAAEIYGKAAGDRMTLPLRGDAAPREVFVAGIWRDYGRQGGAVVIERAVYADITGDRLANDAALWLADGADVGAVRSALEAVSPSLEIAAPGEIRRASLAVFDRTFAVTYGLEAVAIVIGLAGLAASFGALVLARRREFGVLVHLGMTRREIGAMLAAQGAIVAAIGVATGLVAGFAISIVLVHVVNWQSFRWGMELHVPVGALAAFALALLAAASVTATLSGRSATAGEAVRAVKDDW
jgi:putative ABC transport system permease protein